MTGATPKLTSRQPSISEARAMRELYPEGVGIESFNSRASGWIDRWGDGERVKKKGHVHEDEGHGGVEAVQGGQRADGLAQALPRLWVINVVTEPPGGWYG